MLGRDQMSDGDAEAVAGETDHVVLEPVRLVRRKGGDQDLIGIELCEGILDRTQRDTVARFPR
jgi:hypothetical protein